MIKTGEQAPDFELPDHDGTPVRLSALRGRPVVLYFYPKADTPGCTTQACGIRDHRADYEAAGVTVLGVSPDPVEAIRKFHDKQDLNFTLLADADHAVADAYGVWGEKSMYGRTYMGVNRSTFIIDADGTVVHVIPKASPKTHDDQVLAALRGRPIVLYFYPKADTPGCTTQACGIRDHRSDYEAAGVTVLGVSPDPVAAIRKFHDKQDLNFTLLADADHAVAEEYGVWGEKKMYGKTYMGVNRSTFIIDADGTVTPAAS